MAAYTYRSLGCLLGLLTILSLTPLLAAPPSEASREASQILQQEESDLLGGTHRAICYSGFRAGQHPDRGEGAVNPSDEEILEDLQILAKEAQYDLIRLYDSQVNSAAVLRLIREHKLDFKVLLGAWLDAEVSNPNCPWQKEPYPDEVLTANKKKNLAELKRAVALAKEYPEEVIAVAVGNEALVDWNDHMVPVETIISYVKKMKRAIEQPVTVADNYVWWAKHGAELAKEVDFVSVHIYPLWEQKDIEEAMDYSIANLLMVREALPDSQLVITEAGWADIASEFGERASQEKQKRYYDELTAWTEEANITTFFFEAFDEDWKGDPNNPMGAEKHWGLFNIDRTPKKAIQALPK